MTGQRTEELIDNWTAEDFEAFAEAYNAYRGRINAETQAIRDREETE